MADRDMRDNRVTRVNQQTTDATPVVVASYTPPVESIVLVHVRIIGIRKSTGASIFAAFTRLYARSEAAAFATGSGGQHEAGTTGYVVDVIDSSGTAQVRVTGAASNTVDWVGRVEFDSYECDFTIAGG